MGEYHFKPAYQHLIVETAKWFMMSPEQKQKHMKKVKISLQLHLFYMLHDLLFHSQYVYRVLLRFLI